MKLFIGALTLMIFFVSFADVAVSAPRRSPPVEKFVPVPSVQTDEVTLSFKDLPILDFIRAVYGDILKLNYSIDPSLSTRIDPVSVNLRNSTKQEVLAYVISLLDGVGILVEDRKNYLLFRPRPAAFGRDVFIYRPRYRSVAYLKNLMGNLFPAGGFSRQPEAKIGGSAGSASVPSSPMLSGDASSPAGSSVDVGTSFGDTDTLVYSGTVDEIERLKELLVSIDVPVGEVNIRAVIFEVGSAKKDGTSIGLAFNILGGKLGLSLGVLSAIGDSASIKSASFDAIFSALSTDSRFRVVSSPSIRVKSGAHGIITVGSDVPILGSVSYDGAGKPIQNVRMMSSGVIFDLMPVVTESAVDLTVKQQVSNFVPTTNGVNSSPTLLKRDISTVVGASHDEIIFLGGLVEVKKSEDTSGFSFLPSWTHSGGSDESRSELLLVLQVQKLVQK